jgi:hypothetical protein
MKKTMMVPTRDREFLYFLVQQEIVTIRNKEFTALQFLANLVALMIEGHHPHRPGDKICLSCSEEFPCSTITRAAYILNIREATDDL